MCFSFCTQKYKKWEKFLIIFLLTNIKFLIEILS